MNDRTPRIRWAGIVFGTLFALVAAAGLLVALDADLLLAVQEWAVPVGLSVGPSTLPFVFVLGVGTLILVMAVIAVVRRARRRERPDPGTGPAAS